MAFTPTTITNTFHQKNGKEKKFGYNGIDVLTFN